jgi:hypothetical protein
MFLSQLTPGHSVFFCSTNSLFLIQNNFSQSHASCLLLKQTCHALFDTLSLHGKLVQGRMRNQIHLHCSGLEWPSVMQAAEVEILDETSLSWDA